MTMGLMTQGMKWTSGLTHFDFYTIFHEFQNLILFLFAVGTREILPASAL